jgi:hypothetical protein
VDLTDMRSIAANLVDDTIMTDEVELRRDPEGVGDDVLDLNTGKLGAPVGDAALIYRGPGAVSGRGDLGAEADDEGGMVASDGRFAGRLPSTAAAAHLGDMLTITASDNPRLVGRQFVVVNIPDGGRPVTQRLSLEERVRAPRR